jgi:Domain of unknown function (DUF5666)
MTIKRLSIIAGVLFVILVGISVYTLAILLPETSQAASTSQTSLSSGTPVPAVTMTTTRASKGRKYIGTIQSLGNQTFVMLLSRGKKTLTVNVDTNTTYTTSNGTTTFSGLQVGEMVQVRGRVDPQNSTTVLAVSILVTSAGGQ